MKGGFRHTISENALTSIFEREMCLPVVVAACVLAGRSRGRVLLHATACVLAGGSPGQVLLHATAGEDEGRYGPRPGRRGRRPLRTERAGFEPAIRV